MMLSLVLITILAVGLAAWVVIHWLSPRRAATLSDLEILFDRDPDRYTHLPRVLSQEDFDFLAASRRGSGLQQALRKRRLRCMNLDLGQMRQEFESLMAIGSLFASAPTAQAEKFALRLARQNFYFSALSTLLRVQLWLNQLVPFGLNVGALAAEIRTLRHDADRVLHALTPSDMGALRDALRSR